jgi:hypothetical protein
MMKKTIVCVLLATIFFAAANAQLTNSKWSGIIKVDNDINVSFNFGKDTLVVYKSDDNSVIETMTYQATNSTFTVVKTSGQSDCDNVPGKYHFEARENALLITLVEDPCGHRSSVLQKLRLTKSVN